MMKLLGKNVRLISDVNMGSLIHSSIPLCCFCSISSAKNGNFILFPVPPCFLLIFCSSPVYKKYRSIGSLETSTVFENGADPRRTPSAAGSILIAVGGYTEAEPSQKSFASFRSQVGAETNAQADHHDRHQSQALDGGTAVS